MSYPEVAHRKQKTNCDVTPLNLARDLHRACNDDWRRASLHLRGLLSNEALGDVRRTKPWQMCTVEMCNLGLALRGHLLSGAEGNRGQGGIWGWLGVGSWVQVRFLFAACSLLLWLAVPFLVRRCFPTVASIQKSSLAETAEVRRTP